MSDITLHPECQKLLAFLTKKQVIDVQMAIELLRKSIDDEHKYISGFETRPFDGERSEIHIPSSAWQLGIPAYVYKPNNLVAADPVIMVYFHGGGLVSGCKESYDSMCKDISRLAGCIIVNTVYRLAPEHKFPAQIEDCVAVTKWVQENKSSIGGTADSKVGVAGDSAGGYLAASVTHEVKVDFQVLVYPMASKVGDYSSPSMVRYRDGPLFTVAGLQWLEACYIPEGGNSSTPRLEINARPKFDHLPPALILLAEHDILLDGGKEYARNLQANGVPVELIVVKGTFHGFFHAVAFCPTLCKENYEKIASFLQQIKAS